MPSPDQGVERVALAELASHRQPFVVFAMHGYIVAGRVDRFTLSAAGVAALLLPSSICPRKSFEHLRLRCHLQTL